MREPFILLDDARPRPGGGAPARVYRGPLQTFVANSGEEVDGAIAAAGEAARSGRHVAGQIAYEAGLALEPTLAGRIRDTGEPLVWLAAFADYEEIAAADVPRWLEREIDPAPGPAHLGPLRPQIARRDYEAAFAALQDAIRAGDIYQANLTFMLEACWLGDPVALYAAIRDRALAGYGGIVFDGKIWSLSFSPELFFAVKDGAVTLKPMKGTRPRGVDDQQDAAFAKELAESEKDRAENLMITDLMRNDVSRVARAGSVRVEKPFAIETYPTVHQMVTTVRATLAEDADATDLLRAIYPCGSITGAPKIRAMELIGELERQPRGIYCGAIGRIDPDGDAAFNVAIRTLRLHDDGCAKLGVGSAIVADSTAGQEWDECLVKSAFAGDATQKIKLIETMDFHPDRGVELIEFHLHRLKESAASLGFACDRHALRNEIQAFCFLNREAAKLRVTMDEDGVWQVAGSPLPEPMPDVVPVAIVPLPVDPDDWRLLHKTTAREFYEQARREAERRGAKEAILQRPDGLLTEGTFTSLFVERGMKLLTPPVANGLLPGVMRAALIEQGRAEEFELKEADLSAGFFIGNALRGLMPARLVP